MQTNITKLEFIEIGVRNFPDARLTQYGWLEEFIKVTEFKDECVFWPFRLNSQGYGIVNHPKLGKDTAVPRAAYRLAIENFPSELIICHKCDNPPCFNPKHLFVGSYKDNTTDMLIKGRRRGPIGETHPAAKLTNEQVREIVAKYATGQYSQRKLGAEYGVCNSTISLIWRRLSRATGHSYVVPFHASSSGLGVNA